MLRKEGLRPNTSTAGWRLFAVHLPTLRSVEVVLRLEVTFSGGASTTSHVVWMRFHRTAVGARLTHAGAP